VGALSNVESGVGPMLSLGSPAEMLGFRYSMQHILFYDIIV
jgi:hypothetical protein